MISLPAAALAPTPVRAASLALVLALAGCTTTFDGSDSKVDYRSQATKTAALDVPPDLTQLAREGRYQPQSGVVSAAALRQPGGAVTAAAPAAVAPAASGDVRLVREGNARWVASPLAPEAVLPLVRNFWQESGFVLVVDDAAAGLLETDWAENRAKLPQDIVRRTIGRVFDSAFSTGERDKFRTRIERTPGGGSEIYISHRGVAEVVADARNERTVWQNRPADSELEAEFLQRLMVRLGSKPEAARSAVAAATPASPAAAARPGQAPAGTGTATELLLSEGFDRAWRQVGLALDRSGFTVEDRDRSAGLYFVRYIDPKLAGKDEPGFFDKLFGRGEAVKPVRYRVLVKAVDGQSTRISVQTSQGDAETGEAARQIIARMGDGLK